MADAGASPCMDIPDLLGPYYIPQSAEIPGIPQNWHESWDILRVALRELEDTGVTPYDAILGLLHVEIIREEACTLDSSSVAHLDHRIGTNYVPTAGERKLLNEYRARGTQKIARISAEIQMDRQRLLSSTGRHAALTALVDPYLALLSPIRATPPEILQEIFERCMPSRHCAIMDTSHPPLLLGRVCSAWRTISLATPVLWSSIHAVVPSTRDESQQRSMTLTKGCDRLRMWLQRSGDCPLSITVSVPNGDGENLPPFMDVILPYSHRWKSLELEPEAHQDISAVWNLTPEDVPLLETLEITDEMPTPETLRFLSAIPNLHRLSLKYFEAHLEVPTCRWDQITGLCLESRRSFFNLDASHVLELVAQCVNLRSCHLAFPIGEPPLVAVPSPSTSRRITLSHLDALSLNAEIAMTAPFNIQRILDTLVLPGLKTLDLTGVLFHPFNPDTYEPPLAFSDLMLAMDELIGRSSCDLRELFLRFAVGNVDDLLRCLHRCPSLTRLDLHRMQIFQQNPEPDFAPIFSALADTSSSAVLCPNLLHLRLTFCDRTDTDHRALTSLIESRCSSAQPGISRLRTARLTLMRRTTVDAEAFAAAMYPSDVTIVEPAGSDRPPRAAWGIPYEDDGMYP